MAMLTGLVILMGLVILGAYLQKNYKIPSPVSLMAIVLCFSATGINNFSFTDPQFDTLVFLALPLLIIADALKLHWDDLKKNWLSLIWVAVISVLLSVGAGVLINNYVIVDYNIPLAGIIALFCMVAATDPVTVSAVFSNFKVPHKLKVLTEGESLFNDATALIIFGLAVIALRDPDAITPLFVAEKAVTVMGGAILIGAVTGYLTIHLLKLSDDAFVETTIILASAYLSYLVSETFHVSGILAVIVNIVIANKRIQEILRDDENRMALASKMKNMFMLRHAVTTRDNHNTILKNIDFVAMFASALLFIAVASAANFSELLEHWHEILAVFIASTAIRAVMMLKFALVSNNVRQMQSVHRHWWSVLTFAGSKGALSILMVHLIPASFPFRDLFETIVIGNILLSTFVYAGILAVIFTICKDKFVAEYEQEIAEGGHH